MEKLVPKLRFPEFKGNWEKKKINEIAEKINSGKTPLGGETVYTENGVTFIRSQNINDDKLLLDNVVYIPEEINKGMKNSVVKPNDILLNITGASLGRSCVVPQNFTTGNVNQHVCIVRLNEKNNPNFIQSFFSSFKGQIIFQSLQTGSGREGLNFESIKGIKINLPFLPEQQKIASFLTSVDERLTLLAQQKEKLELYKKGVMQQIFSQKLRFKDENGEDYPDWEEKKLGEICKLQGGFAFKSNEFKETGIPVIRISNISNHTNHIDLNSIVFYNKIEKDENFTIKKGDLIIAMSGATTGKSSIYNLEYYAYLNQRVGLFKSLTNKLEYNFLIQFVFSDFFKKQLDSLLVAGAQPNISSKDIESLSLPFPATEEQQKIASFLSAIDVQIEGVSKKIEQTKVFKKGLLQQMFV